MSAYELMKDCNGAFTNILATLARTGQIEQPVIFAGHQLTSDKLMSELEKIPAQYSRQGTSIRPLYKEYMPCLPHINHCISIGELIEGDLIVTNLEKWWHNIDIRFRYKNMVNPMGATNRTNIPYIDNSGNRLQRNQEKENEFLVNLYGKINTKYSTLTLDKADTISLRQLIESGWKVFIRKGKRSKVSQLKIVPNKYGIEWFSTTDGDYELSDNLLNKLLAAFLKNQNFYESKTGDIDIVNNRQIEDIPVDEIANVIDPIPNLKQIYSRHHHWVYLDRDTSQQHQPAFHHR